MDELTLLRNARSDVPEASDDVLNKGRAALFNRINGAGSIVSRSPKRNDRTRWAGAGIGVLGAAALVTGLVVTNVIGVAGWRGSAEPAAAEVLKSAALASIENSDPILGAGQYLRVDTEAVHGSTITNDELYIPADRTDDWVWVRGLSELSETSGPGSERGADYDEILRAPKGAFYSYENDHSPDRLAALPRDPALLLKHIYETTVGSGLSPEGEALVWIADTLRFGAVPADLRAALYNAAAMIPGVEITEKQANLNGVVGIAIGRLEKVNGIRQDLVIDPVTGQLIGERQVETRDDQQGGSKTYTITSSTAISMTVVDSAPEGGTQNGELDEMKCEVTGPGTFQCPTEGDTDE